MPADQTLSPRLEKLKSDLVSLVPTRSQAAATDLGSKGLTGVVIQYLTWRARLIRPRQRDVVIFPEVRQSAHYGAYQQEVEAIAKAFRDGTDMEPYLSNLVRSHAYAAELPPPQTPLSNDEWIARTWRGKDRVRVTVDAHHLHLGGMQQDGTVARSGPLLFAGITPDRAFLLTIGDHASFSDGTVSKIMHDRLEAQAAAQGGGAFLGGPMITLGGTQVKDTMRAQELVRQIREIDRRIDEGFSGLPADASIELDWDDIVVSDPATGQEIDRLPGNL